MTTETLTSRTDLLFPEAQPLFGDFGARLRKGWARYGARFMIAAASLCLALVEAYGVTAGITGAGTLA